jgi:hypothetical protein
MLKGFNLIQSGSSRNLFIDIELIEFEKVYQKFKSYLLVDVSNQLILKALCFL